MRWVVTVLTCLLGMPGLAAGVGRPVLIVGDSLARGLQPTLGSLIPPRAGSSGTSTAGAPRQKASPGCAPTCAACGRPRC